MEPTCVAFHLEQSEGHFWFGSRRSFLQSRLLSLFKKDDVLLDIGCGDGRELNWMLRHVGRAYGIEPDARLGAAARERGLRVQNMPFSTADGVECTPTFITMFDVLEHLPDDREAIRQIYHLLPASGIFAVTVPAHQWLWTSHDVANHHYRRYSKPALLAALQGAGFKIERVDWFGAAALLTAVALKWLGRDQGALIQSNNGFMTKIATWEYTLERYIRVPFGLSLFVVATKHDAQT